MTVDTNRRKLEMQEALIRFYQDVEDRSVRDVELLPNGSDYEGLWLATTWVALDEQSLLDRIGRPVEVVYTLSAFGWYTGLKLAGGLESADVRLRATRMMQAMKLKIDGRRDFDPKPVPMQEIAESANVPRGWASNALHSMFLFHDLFGSKYNAHPAHPDIDTIIILPTFGHTHIQYSEQATISRE